MRLSGRGVRCVRGGREVFSGLDFEASSGEALAVTGPNGSGKTSLLRMIAGLLAPAAGSIDLDGGEAELTLPEQAHYLGHRDALKPALSVLENLSFWRDFLGGERPIPPRASPRSGSTMRPHLPAALSVGRPAAAAVDRPAAGGAAAGLAAGRADLGARCRRAKPVRRLMRDHLARGGLIIAATHAPLGMTAQELRIGGRRMTGKRHDLRRRPLRPSPLAGEGQGGEWPHATASSPRQPPQLFSAPCAAEMKSQARMLGYPPPQPSPARGEGAIKRRSLA